MNSTSRGRANRALPLPSSLAQLEVVTSVPFMARRTEPGARSSQRPQRGLFRFLVAAIALCGLTTMVGVWYLQRDLPLAQKRAKESEALLAPPSRSFCSRRRPPMVCAHGGDTTHAPPNTVPAFRAALAAGADCVEVDAALSRDGVLVVMHVRELAQLLGDGRKGVQVGNLPASQLLALRWASGESVMSVEEAVRLTAPFVDCVTLDVKTYNDQSGTALDEEAIAEALVGLVRRTRCSNCLIWAKSDTVVRRILELSPGQRTGYIVMNETEESRQLGMQHPLRFGRPSASPPHYLRGQQPGQQQPQQPGQQPQPSQGQQPQPSQGQQPGSQGQHPSRRDGAPQQPSGSGGSGGGSGSGYHQPQQGQQPGLQPQQGQQPGGGHSQPGVAGVHFAMVEPQLLDVLHSAGKQLFAWTINHAEVLRAVLDVGVDALVTNYPLTALEAIESRLAKCGGGGVGGGGGVRWPRPNGTRPGGGGSGGGGGGGGGRGRGGVEEDDLLAEGDYL